jgi:DNA mismatch repair protein MutS
MTMAAYDTPLMRQHQEIKRQHPDAILFFRVGDFYEMFGDDAVVASKILQITLTSRDKGKENAVPLCGVPYHAAAGYIDRLLAVGRSVALCEQMEEAGAGKGMLRREVVRVITPGTVIEPHLLNGREPNAVAALWQDTDQTVGLACLDLSTGDFRRTTLPGWGRVEDALVAIGPKELILPSDLAEKFAAHFAPHVPAPPPDPADSSDPVGPGGPALPSLDFVDIRRSQWLFRSVSSSFFSPDTAHRLLVSHLGVFSVSALGDARDPGLTAAGGLLGYVGSVQKGMLGSVTALHVYASGEMRLSARTLRHLDLLPVSRRSDEGNLLHVLDRTLTPMGGRLLREWVLRPLTTLSAILSRQERIAAFYDAPTPRMRLRTDLAEVADLSRLIGRISLKAATPPDMIALSKSLAALPDIEKRLADLPVFQAAFQEGGASWDTLSDIARQIDAALVDSPPLSVKDGGVIREGHLPALDEWRRFQKEGRGMMAQMEQDERRRTGIESLKIRYNNLFGYSIEVTDAQAKNVPSDYIRKQTLARAERYTTEALRGVEAKLIAADATVLRLEAEAYEALCLAIARQTARIQQMAGTVAEIDVLSALAEVAHRNGYVRPTLSEEGEIAIVDGRHPVLEQAGAVFVPNDTRIDLTTRRLLILTGPNMAGKSTYMKQVGLMVLMAQIGSFVPARAAKIGLVDQLFTRVGAEDDLQRGMSTFMVEMTEMAHILRCATPRSLLLLDEIGRGTSTFDGMSIAQAICEAVHRIGVRTLFATHYHELVRLGETDGIHNLHTHVKEAGEEILFLRKMIDGGADQSYGIHVARLAGLPAGVIARAREILYAMEAGESLHRSPPRNRDDAESEPADPQGHPVVASLRAIDPDQVTPMQALQILVELKRLAG